MRRSTRANKPIKFFDDNPDYAQPSKPKKNKKEALPEVVPPETRPAEDPPAPAFQQLKAQKDTQYTPPIQVAFTPFKVNWIERELFDLFIKLLS